MQKSTREKESMKEREREREKTGGEDTCGWPLVIFIGRVYRRALGTKKKEKKSEGREERAGAKNEEAREKERTGSESIR